MDTSPNDTTSRSSHHSFSSTINQLLYSGTGSMPSEFAKQTSKSTNKLATYSCHISFLKACREHDIIPRGLRLKNPLKDAKSQATIHSASLKTSQEPAPAFPEILPPAEGYARYNLTRVKTDTERRILR